MRNLQNALGKLAGLAVVLAVALGGCGNGAKEAEGDTSVEKPSDEVSQGDIQSYFRALASWDPAKIEAVLPLTAKGSIAEGYALFNIHRATAAIDGGDPYDSEIHLKTFKAVSQGYRSCDTQEAGKKPEGCTVWSDIQTKAGKIASFTVNGTSLKNRIVIGDGKTIDLGSLGTLEYLSAYQWVTDGGGVQVNFRLKSTGQTIATGDMNDAKYRTSEGRQIITSGASHPGELAPDSTADVSIAFDRAEMGGEVSFTLTDGGYGSERPVTVRIG